MNFTEAYNSGKQYRRKGDKDWQLPHLREISRFTGIEATATDWETKPTTVKCLKSMWQLLSQFPNSCFDDKGILFVKNSIKGIECIVFPSDFIHLGKEYKGTEHPGYSCITNPVMLEEKEIPHGQT